MKNQGDAQYVLGLDIGANSIGWVVMNTNSANGDTNTPSPAGIGRIGVRVFDAGTEGDIEAGKDESRAVARREARLRRRQTDRRARRLSKLFNTLQRAGLLPPGDANSPEARDKFIAALDHEITSRYTEQNEGDEKRIKAHVIPYLLRARALDEKLTLHELGRAIYHLAQRRGFKSNRKAAPKKDEEQGKVKKGIAELTDKMEEADARTLGEYFAGLDPEQERIRSRWTSRTMYEDEFEKIWAAQKVYHPAILTDELKAEVYKVIFYQRPLKSQKHLIGKCPYETNKPRAPWATLEAQRFRMLQKINNTEIITPQGEVLELKSKECTPMRQDLVKELETKGDIKYKEAKKIMGLSGDHIFNFERSGDKHFIGNHTAAKLGDVFRERWNRFSDEERDRIIEDVLSIENEEALARRGMKAWGLDDESAGNFAKISLDDGYCNLSRKALKKLLPLMEKGISYMTAVKEVYGDRPLPEAVDMLPPVVHALPEIRNPVVTRTLTELRKVVNAIIREYGKPEIIRVELARELKNPRKRRKQISDKIKENEKARAEAAEKITKEAGIQKPTPTDILKYRLAEECNWECPYTGKRINMSNLYSYPQFDIEHIIPFHRSLDNSFVNKTLCYHEENRKVKRNRTPHEAYSSTAGWDEILERVKKFKGPAAREKLRRFKLTPDEVEKNFSEFSHRQLNDTSYASRLAVEYLGLLYGGRIDEGGRLRVQGGRGRITKYLRDVWDLNSILGDGGRKKREDHRHHAVDAVCIALTDPSTVKTLSNAAKRAQLERRRHFGAVPPPWEGFLDSVREAIDGIIVSHRVSKKVSGPLHEETLYSPPKRDENGKIFHAVRKKLDDLSANEVEHIVDPTVKRIVKAKLEELGKKNPKDAFKEKANHPYLTAKDGRKIPIHKVRIKKYEHAQPIGEGPTERHVLTGSNHHVEIFAFKDKKGKLKWDGEIVTMYEATQRLRRKEPVVKREHGEGKEFVFSLASGEIIEIDEDEEGGGRGLYRIRTVSHLRVKDREYVNLAFVKINDARPIKEIKKEKEWKTALLEPLRKLNCRKVTVTPLGEVRWAND